LPLLFLLVLFPILEVLVMMMLHQLLAEYVGFWFALFVVLVGVVLTAGIGLSLLGREVRSVWQRFGTQVRSGAAPTQEVLEGLMLLVGAVCLMTPGYLTDIFGFICVIGKSRKKLGSWLSERLRHLTVVEVFQNGGPRKQNSGGSERYDVLSDKEPPRSV